jgi:hypothetical protein
MLDKTTHPFIVNTMESSCNWKLIIDKYPANLLPWGVSLVHNNKWGDAISHFANSLPEALDRLEAELAGREPVAKSRDPLSEAINNWASLNWSGEDS